MSEPFNLARLIGESGVTLEIEKRFVVSFSTGKISSAWAISVSRNRLTKSGRQGKPEYVFALVANEDETPADLLRQLATAYDQGEVAVERATLETA